MTGQLDTKPRWSFGGISLLVAQARFHSAIRAHRTVYPYMPGAKPEKMGREPYEITIEGEFASNTINPLYRTGLIDMAAVRRLVDEEETADLVIPWVGTIKAYISSLEITERNSNRSDLSFSITFSEDSDFEFPIERFLSVNLTNLSTARIDFRKKAPKKSIFDQIDEAVSFVLGVRDQLFAFKALIESKIMFLEHLFREADATADALQDPDNALFLDSFMALWAAAREVWEDMDQKGVSLKSYLVPMNMSLSDIATAIYGSPERTLDLLGLNAIEDPYLIRAGTEIRYYE